MRKTASILIGLVILTSGLVAVAQDRAELEVDHALTFDFMTPHTNWARPFARGKTRVLFFTDGRGTRPRECVELMERFDLEAAAVFWARIVDSSNSHWHGGEAGERRMLELLQKEWDCYVFFGFSPARMSAEQQVRLLKPVSEGAGLLLVGATDARVLKPKNQLKRLPPFLRGTGATAFTVGKGRGVYVPTPPALDYHPGWEEEYDYQAEALGRTLLWAAGREPRATVSVTVDEPSFSRSRLQQGTAGFTWQADGLSQGVKTRAEIRVRKPGGQSRTTLRRGVVAGRPYRETLPVLPAGTYHADVRLLSARGVEAWTTQTFRVDSPVHVTAVKLTRGWGEIGDRMQGAVALEGVAPAGMQVWVSLFDSRDRELKRQVLTGKPFQFGFRLEPWFPMLLRVTATLHAPGKSGILDSGYAWFHVTKRNRGRFNFLIWDVPNGTLAPYAEQSLAENAVTLQLSGSPNPPVYVAANNIAWVPYTTRIMTPKTPEGIMKPFCWNDEKAVHAQVTKLAEKYLPARQHGVFVYSLGDEVTTLGCCLSPHCARAYREYLKKVYGTLTALNESWGTHFRAWDEVGLSKPGDSEEANSLSNQDYPRWFDRQAFKSYNFVQFCQKYAAAYKTIDPKAKTGFEGAGRFARGDDLDLIIRSNGFWSPYPGTADEVVRSLAPPGFPHSNWMGYTKDADSLLQKYWRMVTRGTDAVWWWRWDCIGRFHGWLAPDLRPYPAVKEILKDTQIVRDGLGDLLLKSKMEDDGIAVLYSYPSVFAHKLAEGATYGGYEASHVAVHHLVRELGLQFRYVSDRMLRLGEFQTQRYKVLILPRCEALGDREAAVIRDFVRNGGTVIADVRPGIYDDHCKPRAGGVLDDLFGVRRKGRAPAKSASAVMEGKGRLSFAKAKVDPTVTVTDGVAGGQAEGTPLAIWKKNGKGGAFLLNCDFSSYPKLGVADTPEAAAVRFRNRLEQAGVVVPLRVVRPRTGRRVRNVEVIRWFDGQIQIVALFRQGGVKEKAEIRLPRASYVYDLRNRRALGRRRVFATTIIPNRASFFVFYPKPAPSGRLTLKNATAMRGTTVRGSLVIPGLAGIHAVRLRAATGGKRLKWLEQNVLVDRAGAEVTIPIALNDPPGEWRIRALDLFTNKAATAVLRVQ